MWKLNNTLLNNQQFREEISRESRKYIKTNENENKIYANLWDAGKDMVRGKLTVVNVYITEKNNLNNLTLNLKKLEKKKNYISYQKEGNNKH